MDENNINEGKLDLQNESVFNPDLDTTLELIRRAVSGEQNDRRFYEYLISVAPTQEEKNIIAEIRDDELGHFDLFRRIYKDITGKYPVPLGKEEFKEPESYLEGIRQALFGELKAVELYRQIYYGLRTREHRDILFEIITDELKHADKWNYLYTKNYLMR